MTCLQKMLVLVLCVLTLAATTVLGADIAPLTVEGEIKSISVKARTISLVSGKKVMLLILDKDVGFVNAKSLREFAEGDKISVTYTLADGTNLATSVIKQVVKLPPGVTVISQTELEQLVEIGPTHGKYRLFDTRPFNQYQEGHIRTAVSAPYDDLARAPEKYLPEEKNLQLIFYCDGSTCDLSASAASLATALGYSHMRVYPDGMPGWKKGNFCVATSLDHIKNGNIVLIDLRTPDKVIQGHIPRAVNIPMNTLKDAEKEFPEYKGALIVFYGVTAAELREAIETVKDWDYSNASAFVGGVEEWQNQGYKLETGPAASTIFYRRNFSSNEIGSVEFKKAIAGSDYQIIDVRSREEFAKGNIPHAINIPLEEIPKRIGELSKDKQIILMCSTGSRAEMAYDILKNSGLKISCLKATIEFGKNGPIIGE